VPIIRYTGRTEVGEGEEKMRAKAILLVLTMVAALGFGGGTALAVNKVCEQASTIDPPTSPTCVGTKKTKTSSGNDTIIGSAVNDWITALSGNDKIAAGEGNDHTDGGAGNDTYSYSDYKPLFGAVAWGTDTLVDASGVDTLNFSAVSGGITANLVAEFGQNEVSGSGGSGNVSLDPQSVIEKVVGSANGPDAIFTGGAANILQPGPGTGGASFRDYGGNGLIPASNDTYSGLIASGYGPLYILDWGGTADKLILPFASTDAYFAAYAAGGGSGSADSLLIMSTHTDYVLINGQLKPWQGVPGHIETIQFTDGNFSIGSASATAAASTTSASSTAEVDKLNAASTLSASKKDELANAAKKIISKAPPSPTTSPEDMTLPK
jgi:hypothetical protein